MTSPIPNVCFVIKKKLSLLSHTVVDHRRGRPVVRTCVTNSAECRVPLFVLTTF